MASLEQLPPSFADTIYLPITIFRFIGLDFFDDEKARVQHFCRLIVFLLVFFVFFIGQILFFMNVDEIGADFLDVANAIACLMIMFQNFCKMRLIGKKHLVRQIIVDIAELWPIDFQMEEKEQLMNEWRDRLKTFTNRVFILTAVSMILYIWLQIFLYLISLSNSDGDTPYLYPFKLYYGFKLNALWKYLVFYILSSAAGTTIHNCLYQCCDLLLLMLSVDVCILMRMLQFDLANLQVEPGREEESLANLKRIVKTHQKIMRLVDQLNEIFGNIMFGVMISSAIIICFFGFLLIITLGIPSQFFANITTVLQILFLVFCIMMPGQILDDTSTGVAAAAYQILWYNSNDPKFKKTILIIIARSQKPCRLQAKGYADMNFNAFCKICSTAWSYLSLVNQMYSKQQN